MIQWLKWAMHEFSLEGVNVKLLAMSGDKLLQLSRDEFLDRLPIFVGDILLEHLEILRKGELMLLICCFSAQYERYSRALG